MKTLPKLSEYIFKVGLPENTDTQFADKVMLYTNFITQPLKLSHFVPAIEKDGKWIVLEKYIKTISEEYWDNNSICRVFSKEEVQYQTALDNLIFKGVEVRMNNDFFSVSKDGKTLFDVFGNKTIESIIKYNLEVNETIIKKFNL